MYLVASPNTKRNIPNMPKVSRMNFNSVYVLKNFLVQKVLRLID